VGGDGAGVGSQLLQKRIAVVGRGLEIAPESGLGIGDKDRKERLAVVAHIERPIVGDELGAERDGKQHQEDPERRIAAPIGLETQPATAIER
jgi:hypothetical protein